MSSRQRTSDDLRAVVDALRSHDRFLLVTHENPDGDAFGSLLGAKLALASLGKDVEMYLPGDALVPKEYAWMQLNDLRRELPSDASERVLLALDCANGDRIGPASGIVEHAPLTVNIDHHQDNSRFGDLNLVVADASSTSEVLRDLLAELDVEVTPEIALPLYVALVTDTGRFQYTNTSSKTLRMAAELVDAGVDPHYVFQRLFESTEFKKLKLRGRVLERAEIYEGGRLVVSHLLRSDFTELNVPEAYSEGLIDALRETDGADMVALIREPPGSGGPARRVSLRARTDELDVSAIAGKSNGGGHRQAAGFSSDASIDEIIRFIREEFARAAPGS